MKTNSILRQIREQLEASGHRLTPQREAVVKALLQSGKQHLSAEDVFMESKKLLPDIGLATVYRSLELLESLNIVYKLEYGDGQSRYELNPGSDEHYHHHLICLECGAITEFNHDLLEEIEGKIREETQFVVTDHCLRFFGYCKNCRGSIDKP